MGDRRRVQSWPGTVALVASALDRVGIAYRFSSNGRFEGVSLVFGSLYDR
jgi:hypothetical protein